MLKLYPLTVFALFFGVDIRARFIILSLNVYFVYFVLKHFTISVARYYYLSLAGFMFLWGLSSVFTIISPTLNTPVAFLMVGLMHTALAYSYSIFPKKGLYLFQIMFLLTVPFNDPIFVGEDQTYRRLFLCNVIWAVEIFIGRFLCKDEKVRLHYLFMVCTPVLRLGPILCVLYTCTVLAFRGYYIRKHYDVTKAAFFKVIEGLRQEKPTHVYESTPTEEEEEEEEEDSQDAMVTLDVERGAIASSTNYSSSANGPSTTSTASSGAKKDNYFSNGTGSGGGTARGPISTSVISPEPLSALNMPISARPAIQKQTNNSAPITAQNTSMSNARDQFPVASMSAKKVQPPIRQTQPPDPYDIVKRNILANPNSRKLFPPSSGTPTSLPPTEQMVRDINPFPAPEVIPELEKQKKITPLKEFF